MNRIFVRHIIGFLKTSAENTMVSTKQEGVSVTSSSIENGQSDDVLDGSILTYLETESMQTKVFQKHDVCKNIISKLFLFLCNYPHPNNF